MECDYVYSYNIGAAFYLVNTDFNKKFIGNWYIIEPIPHFYEKINMQLQNSRLKNIIANNKNEIIFFINNVTLNDLIIKKCNLLNH
jgi:ABC-type transporter lipoprotein component MlaA